MNSKINQFISFSIKFNINFATNYSNFFSYLFDSFIWAFELIFWVFLEFAGNLQALCKSRTHSIWICFSQTRKLQKVKPKHSSLNLNKVFTLKIRFFDSFSKKHFFEKNFWLKTLQQCLMKQLKAKK